MTDNQDSKIKVGVQTPPTDRPLTAGDIPLLREGDVLRSITDEYYWRKNGATCVVLDPPALKHFPEHIHYRAIRTDGSEGLGSTGDPNTFAFVFRPGSNDQIQRLDADRIGDLKDVALVTRVRAQLRAEAALNTRRATSDGDGDPVAWKYELASCICSDGTYTNWQPAVVRLEPPRVPEGSIRNLTPLYAALASPPVSERERELSFSVDDLAQEIRRVGDNHSLGAGALAEALMPFLTAQPAGEK